MRKQSSPARESVVCFGLPHVVLVALVALFVSAQALAAAGSADYQAAIRKFEDAIRAELSRGLISGLSVTWVDDQQIVYANGFGFADKARRHPAKPDTIYRCGSISKLFTAVAAMQLVEQGKLDLDQPVTDFAPDFRVANPFLNCYQSFSKMKLFLLNLDSSFLDLLRELCFFPHLFSGSSGMPAASNAALIRATVSSEPLAAKHRTGTGFSGSL